MADSSITLCCEFVDPTLSSLVDSLLKGITLAETKHHYYKAVCLNISQKTLDAPGQATTNTTKIQFLPNDVNKLF